MGLKGYVCIVGEAFSFMGYRISGRFCRVERDGLGTYVCGVGLMSGGYMSLIYFRLFFT